MPILNMSYSINQGGANIGEPSDLAVTVSGLDATITWTDNDLNTIPPSTFSKSVLVRKMGSAPTTPTDGTLVVTETVKDTYKTIGYIDSGLTDGETYYYKVFSYSDSGGITYCEAVNVTISLGRPTITSFNYASKTLSTPQGTYGDENAITFSKDGTKLYFAGENRNAVYQWTLSTAWDVTTATYDNKFKSTGLNVTTSIMFSDDGTIMWIGGGWSAAYIYKYTLSTARDVSTATYVGDATGKSNVSFFECTGIYMSRNGQYAFALSRANSWIRRYTMTTPYDVTTMQGGAGEYQQVGISAYSHTVQLNPQGTQLFYYDRDDKKIHICSLSTPFDLTTLTETSQYTVPTPNSGDITEIHIDNLGNSMYLGGWNLSNIYQYNTVTS